MTQIRVSVQAEPRDLQSWLELARRLEDAGFDGLVMADHPGSAASPWPALGSAAAVTRTLRLGTCMAQTGVREPAHVAADAATLDRLAPGRVTLGLGAGHTPREWSDLGQERPSPHERAYRLAAFVEATAALLRGETVTRDAGPVRLRNCRLEDLPAADRVLLAVGGGHPLILQAAARHADVVSLSGLGRTLPDGHRHEVRWSRARLRRQLDLVRDEAQLAGRSPVIEALVQAVQVTADRDAALAELADRLRAVSTAELARTPFLLIGTREQLAAQLRAQADELGITSYVIREPAVPDMTDVLALVRQASTR